MTAAQLGFVGLTSVALSCSLFSLWENPLGGRKPRQRRGGIFHTLRAALRDGFGYARSKVRAMTSTPQARAGMSTPRERRKPSDRRQP